MAAKAKASVSGKKRFILPILLGVIAVGVIGVTTYVLTGNSLYELDPNAYVAGFSSSLSSMKKVTLSEFDIENSNNFLKLKSILPLDEYFNLQSIVDEGGVTVTNLFDTVSFVKNKTIRFVQFSEGKEENIEFITRSIVGSDTSAYQLSYFATQAKYNKFSKEGYTSNLFLDGESQVVSYQKIGGGFELCNKTALLAKFSSQYTGTPGYDTFIENKQGQVAIAYPKQVNTYYVSDPVCFVAGANDIITDKRTGTWEGIIDSRADTLYPASVTHGVQTGNILVMTVNHGFSDGAYNLEEIYLTDNHFASDYFDKTYCQTTTGGTLDKLHCTKKIGNKYWHAMQYTWNGTINGQNQTKVFTVAGFVQFVTRPYTFTNNTKDGLKSVLTGGMYQYRWWEDIAKYRSNAKNAWRWDQDYIDDRTGKTTSVPITNPVWTLK